MKFRIEKWTITELIKTYEDGKLNLSPSYQRNDIWPPVSKKRLIESIKLGYPLPAFFLHEKKNNKFDIVDGQQRTRTFIGFRKGIFPDHNKKYFDDEDEKLYNQFELSVTVVTVESNDLGSIEDFYFRVNKYGVKLNRPEIKRSEYPNSPVQNLIERISENDDFIRLGLFSAKSTERLNDLDFISEILALIKYGATDKKIAADRLYEEVKENDIENLEEAFTSILERISELNEVFPFNKSRYKQRNDFYTLFHFLMLHGEKLNQEFLIYQYKILILIDDDIYPTNEKCWPFQEYANNCVSQSNSKRAREGRLIFFEKLLLNKIAKITPEENEFMSDIVMYYDLADPKLVHVNKDYFLINVKLLNVIKKKPFHD